MIEVRKQSATLLTHSDPLEMAEHAARICYDSVDKMKPGSAEPMVRSLIKLGHYTPLEHACVCVYIDKVEDKEARSYVENLYQFAAPLDFPFCDRRLTRGSFYKGTDDNGQYVVGNLRDISWYLGQHTDPIDIIKQAAVPAPNYAVLELITDRGIATEFFRHRTMSYDETGAELGTKALPVDFCLEPSINQQSTRYVNFDKRGAFLILPEPADWAYDPEGFKYKFWYEACNNAVYKYLDLVATGLMTPEYARNVLPLSLGTKVVMSGSLMNWLYVLNLRLPKGAHPQARLLASYIWDALMADPHHKSYINHILYEGKLDHQFEHIDFAEEVADIQSQIK